MPIPYIAPLVRVCDLAHLFAWLCTVVIASSSTFGGGGESHRAEGRAPGLVDIAVGSPNPTDLGRALYVTVSASAL